MFKSSDKSSSIKLYSSDSDNETTARLAKLKIGQHQQQGTKKTTRSPSPPLARPSSGYRQSDSEHSKSSKVKSTNYSDDYEDDFEDSASKASKRLDSRNGKDRPASSKQSDHYGDSSKRKSKYHRSASSSPSPDRKDAAVVKRVDHFSRPRAREETSSESSSDEKKSKKKTTLDKPKPSVTAKGRSNSMSSGSSSSHTGFLRESSSSKAGNGKSSVKFESKSSDKKALYDSDSDSARKPGKAASTPKKSAPAKSPRSSYSSSSSRSRSRSSSEGSKKRDKKSSKSKQRADDSAEDSQRTLSPPSDTPIRVNIGRKPPIDKSSWNKKHNRSINFDRPNDSGSDHERKAKSSHHQRNNLNETFDLESPAGSSNEMTDVSPLPSPKKQQQQQHRHRQSSKDGSHFMKSRYEDDKDEDKLDMDSFYKSLSHDINSRMDLAFKSIRSGRSSATATAKDMNTSVDSVGQRRSNRLLNIEDENQRLLKKIRKEKSLGVPDRPLRLTSSAINRQREQQRIEKENQLLYRRLTSVKASTYLKKQEQLKDYERNFGFNIMKYAKMTSSTPGHSTANTSLLTTDGMNSVLSTKRSAKASESNSRVSSAANHSRISSTVSTSAKGHHFSLTSLEAKEILKQAGFGGSKQRPEWNDRW